MPEIDYINVKDPFGAAPAAVGNGVADDTAAIQQKINILTWNNNDPTIADDGRALFFPWGRYKITSKLTVPERIRLVGQGHSGTRADDGNLLRSVLQFDHPGTGIEVTGQFAHIENLAFLGQDATGDAISGIDVVGTGSLPGGQGSRIEHCVFRRQGGKAAVRLGRGGGRFLDNMIEAQNDPTQWSYDAAAMAPARGHALWCDAIADHMISGNSLSSEGAGLYLYSCLGLNVHDNFIYNSNVGVYLAGTGRCSIADNRCEEHMREGLVIDWNSNGNTITGNRFHNNGARTTEAAVDRVGLLLRSGASNVVVANAFDNWDHDVQQPGGIDYRSPQQYGVRIKPVGTTDTNPNRPWPRYNLIGSNTFREQKTASILNDFAGDTTNKFRDNVAADLPGGVLASYDADPPTATPTDRPQVHAATAGPAALLAGLVALRNRRRRS